MKLRIWEDKHAMHIVSVLGFLMNDDGNVVGTERTQVLCQLMPSIHTTTHRGILGMMIHGLNEDDAQTFFKENGLKILNEWLLAGIEPSKQESKKIPAEKRRLEIFGLIRAFLHILDICVTLEATRRENSYLLDVLRKLPDFLEAGGNKNSDFVAERSRLNIHRKHFENACMITTSNTKYSYPPAPPPPSAATAPSSSSPSCTPASSSGQRERPYSPPPNPSSMIIPGNKMDNQDVDPSTSTISTTSSNTTTTTASTSDTTSNSTKPASIASILEYQPKTFLQRPTEASKNEDDEFDESGDVLMDGEGNEGLITNVPRANAPSVQEAGLDHKIRSQGHEMDYTDRGSCSHCCRVASKRCTKCNRCVRCGQRDRCGQGSGNSSPVPGAQGEGKTDQEATTEDGSVTAASRRTNLSVNDRNLQVLTPLMDQAIYKAFKKEDFHTAFSLIANGMDVNFQRPDCDSSTILMAAAQHGRDDAVTKLLQLGANPCIKDTHGDMAWKFAERNGHTKLKDKLFQQALDWQSQHPPSASSGSNSDTNNGPP